jgi:hypothetical protein
MIAIVDEIRAKMKFSPDVSLVSRTEMNRVLAAAFLFGVTTQAHAQNLAIAPEPPPAATIAGSPIDPATATAPIDFAAAAPESTFLTGNRMFPDFIGFMSNPILNVDPRAMTSIWPMFGTMEFRGIPALPSGDQQVYGAGLYVALNDRLSIGMTQGGYTAIHLEQGNGPFRDRFQRLRDRRQFVGDREGWLNLGGYVQYTLISNPEERFLFTIGGHWTAPSGSEAVFQGLGPARLAPYATVGKAWGQVHVLATGGYDFPAGSGGAGLEYFYFNVHIDRQFGWLYPLVEFNTVYHQSNIGDDAPLRGGGLLNFGDFSSGGNLVTLAAGANAVLVPGKLELGAVYMTPIAHQREFTFDGLLVKMMYRY